MREKGWEVASQYAREQRIANIAWAAGFFDGEGTIRAKKNGSLHLSISQIDIRPLEKFKRALGDIGVIRGPYLTPHKPKFVYEITNSPIAKEAMLQLYPYLSLKMEQCDKALDSFENRPNKGRGRKLGTTFSLCRRGHEIKVHGKYRYCMECHVERNRQYRKRKNATVLHI